MHLMMDCAMHTNVNLLADMTRNPTPKTPASVPMLTNDTQIGSDLRVWADEDDRTDFDQQR
jgi:hypothetical protein